MASPVDAGRATTNISTAADPWTLNLPGSIASGDLLFMWLRNADTTQSIGATGWNPLLLPESPDAADDTNEMWMKLGDGTEGATLSWDMAASSKGATIIWRITGAFASAVGGDPSAPKNSAATVTAAANINPGALTPDNPSGSNDYLWLSCIGMDSETGTATNGTLSNVVSANSGTGGAVATNCIIWGGSLASTASSIDIAAWTSSAPANGASAYTVVIYPAAAAASTLVLEYGFVNYSDPGVL